MNRHLKNCIDQMLTGTGFALFFDYLIEKVNRYIPYFEILFKWAILNLVVVVGF